VLLFHIPHRPPVWSKLVTAGVIVMPGILALENWTLTLTDSSKCLSTVRIC